MKRKLYIHLRTHQPRKEPAKAATTVVLGTSLTAFCQKRLTPNRIALVPAEKEFLVWKALKSLLRIVCRSHWAHLPQIFDPLEVRAG
jgi:hypothetical protein